MTPPWPSMSAPQSFTPRSRLMADITRPPANPRPHSARLTRPDCHGVNGVAHHRAAPAADAVRTPPTSPSHVLPGLTVGTTGWRPIVLPQTYWNTSLNCTTATR